jgi:tetratricopeptide (TPR) repeat protein
MRGVLYNTLGQPGQAIDNFDAALTRGSPPFEIYQRRAGAFLDLRQYQSALADVNTALELQPDNARSLALRCRILGENRGSVAVREVLADCERARLLAPQNASVHFNVGNGYAFLDKYEEAAEAFTRVIELKPNDARAYLNRGRLRLDFLYEPEAAIDDLNQAISIWPGFHLAYYHRGRAHWQETNLEQAMSDLQYAEPIADAIGINFYIERARVYYWAGEYHQALMDYERVLSNDPFQSSTHYRVILLQYALRDLDDAASSVEEALQRSEEIGMFDSEDLVLILGGNIALERTDYAEAIDYYVRASDLIENTTGEVLLNLRLRFAELLRGDDPTGVQQRIFSMLATVDSSRTRAWVSHYLALTYLYDARQTTSSSDQQALYRDALTGLETAGSISILQIQTLRGHLHALLGEADAADAAFADALQIVNDMNQLIEPNETALIGMLYTFMAQHEAARSNSELARTYAEQAIGIAPHLPAPYRILYTYYLEQENPSEVGRYQRLYDEAQAACNHCEIMSLTIH